MIMIHQIIKIILLVGLLFLGSAEYIPLQGSTEVDETEYCNKLRQMKDSIPGTDSYLPVVEGGQLDSGIGTDSDKALIGLDYIFKFTKHVLKGNGSVHRKVKFIADCGFFDTVSFLMNDQPLVAWLVCKAMNIMFSEFKYSVFRKALVDELFKHDIIERVVELALSDDESLMNKELTWGPSKVNTVKEEASKSILLVADWSNDRQLDNLVELGALDVACHLARTMQPPNEDRIIILSLEAASKLRSISHRPGERTLYDEDDYIRQAKLCDASKNYCRFYYCGKWKEIHEIGCLVLVFLFILSSVAAFLWFLWTSLDPAKSKEKNDSNTKNSAKDSENKKEADKQDENKCAKCGKIVPDSGTKECSKCGVVYCSRSCQKADVSVYILCPHVHMICLTSSPLPHSGQRINRYASS